VAAARARWGARGDGEEEAAVVKTAEEMRA
jgi:hypothetical protein